MSPSRVFSAGVVALLASTALVVAAPAQGGRAATEAIVYVAPSSPLPPQGTLEAPYTSFASALKALGPDGGTILARGGRYVRQRIVLDHRRDITVRAYGGETPVLDATGLAPPARTSGVVEIRGGSDLRIEGLDITGYRTRSQKAVPVGVYAVGSPQRLILEGNHIHDLGNDNPERGSYDINAHGIAVYGTDAERPARGLQILRNEVDHLVLGASESVVVNGNVVDFSIIGNHVHHNNNIGIDAIGYESTITGPARWTDVNRARRGVIAHNLVTDIVSRGNPSYWESPGWCNCADGIYVDGGKDIAITDNVVRRSDIGIEAASEWPRGGTEQIRIRRNRVTASAFTGLAIGGYGPHRGEASEVLVQGNTFRGNNTLDDGSPEVLLQFKVHDTQVVGNSITATHRDQPFLLKRVRRAGSAAQNVRVRVDRNDYGVPGPVGDAVFSDAGERVTGLAAWRGLSGQDLHSTVTRR